jgi:hypothetical protein
MSFQTNFRANTNIKFIRGMIRGNQVAFEAYTGNYGFGADAGTVGDMNWDNYICNTCHTQTDNHQNDGTATISQDHHDGEDCTICHAHTAGYQLPDVPAPHDEYTFDCTECHDPGTYVPDANIANDKCMLSCHDVGAPLAGGGPDGTGANTKVTTHFGTTYNDPTTGAALDADCVECHNPMSLQTNFRAGTNIKFIRDAIRGTSVAFEAQTGPYSFADDANMPGDMSTENYLCNTCHTQTNHHQNDGTAPDGQSHNDGTNCLGCHPHNNGLQSVGGSCLDCHKLSPPAGSSDPNRRQVVENAGDGNGDFVKTVHMVTDGTTNEIVTEDACLVCHEQSNHEQFGDGESTRLVDQDNAGNFIDYLGAGTSPEQFCTGCHDSNGSVVNGSQPFSTSGDTNSAVDIGWSPNMMAHSGNNGNADGCFGCHGDEGGNINAHGSNNAKLLQFNNYNPVDTSPFCYNCHTSTGPATVDVETAFDLPYSHRTGSEDCMSCHSQHQARQGLHVEGSTNLDDMIGGVNAGMGFNYEYEICFQCHDTPIVKTNLNSENNMDNTFGGGGVYATYWSNMPDIQSQFSISNLAYHPLFAVGLNQPSNSLNSAWDTDPDRKDDTAPGGPFNGLDNNFVDGWKSTSLVTCSDCHGNGTANGARGIHGSDYPWLNRRLETDVTVTTAGSGVLTPNVGGDIEAYTASNFCVNCHRSDVYGFGSAKAEPLYWQPDFPRVAHDGSQYNRACKKTNIEASKGGFSKIGCSNCHGGSEVAGIHGTNLTETGSGNMQLGIRFMNGNSREGLVVSGNSVSCYATETPAPLNVQLSSCSAHSNKASSSSDYNYDY